MAKKCKKYYPILRKKINKMFNLNYFFYKIKKEINKMIILHVENN